MDDRTKEQGDISKSLIGKEAIDIRSNFWERINKTDLPRHKPAHPTTIIGTGNKSNKDTEPTTGLTDRQNLTPALINTALDAMGIEYQRDSDGVYQLLLPNDTVAVMLSLTETSEIYIVCVYTDPIPGKKWMKALLACNEFHFTSKFGRAYFIPRKEKDAAFIYELYQGFEGGMVSEEYLIQTLLKAIEHAGEVFTKIEKWCSS